MTHPFIPEGADPAHHVDQVLAEVRAEVLEAMDRNPRFNSAHEGKAVIEEELDELWLEVKANRGYSYDARCEAKQTAAMAVRYMLDLTAPLEESAR